MRFFFAILLASFGLGMILPQPEARGHICSDVTNTHSSDIMSCGGTNSEIFAVEKLENTSSTAAYNPSCIRAVTWYFNIEDVSYSNQCENLDPLEIKTNVVVNADLKACSGGSTAQNNFETTVADAASGGTVCSSPGQNNAQRHPHSGLFPPCAADSGCYDD
jgi:hypothetical protein